MKSNKKKCFFIIVATLVFYSCTKVINVDLNSTAPKIVIEGNITNAAGPYQVQITKTVNFSASNVYPPVSGAMVKITDSTTGASNTLAETTAGVYTTSTIQGIAGHTYLLSVLAEGKTYTASSTMPQAVALDSLTFQKNNSFGNTRFFAVPNFQDPAGIANYYTFTEYINNVKFTKFVFVFDDRLSDGRYISQQLFTDSSYINIGDSVALQMNCVDKNVYNYFNTLQEAISGNSFQSASPSNPISNISNGALGYFSASTVSKKKRKVN
jgi:hypothetical protein